MAKVKTVFFCTNCGNEFNSPETLYENHELNTPPYEAIYVCPRCKSTDYQNAKYRYCHCCGARLNKNQNLYCSSRCEANGKKLYKLEQSRQKILADSVLYKLVREIEDYNFKNQKKLSYGQYVSLFKRRGKKK
mgnify:CR=1 FL=1